MPQKRKIALFSTSFLPYSQTFVYDEIRAHTEKYDITVFCKDRQNEDRFPFNNFHKPKGKIAEHIYHNIAYWPKFDQIFRKEKFDLIHAHFGTGAVYALPYVKKFKIPFIVTFHGNDVAALMGSQKYQLKRWRYVFKSNQILNYSDIILAASEELKALLIELGADKNKVQTYRLGIDLSNFKLSTRKPSEVINFIMIGRFVQKKGHIYALKAFHEVIKNNKKVHLTIVGTGILENKIKEFVKSNNLESHVRFTGVLTPDEVSKTLSEMDVLLAPSIVSHDMSRESGLIVVKEAAAVGLPAIGTWHGGIHEIIDHEVSGFLVPERNVKELTKRMIQFIEKPELIINLGSAARLKMEESYDLYKQVKELEKIYERAISIKK